MSELTMEIVSIFAAMRRHLVFTWRAPAVGASSYNPYECSLVAVTSRGEGWVGLYAWSRGEYFKSIILTLLEMLPIIFFKMSHL
jgi:hypothetical protein